jgi:hypothetical protein
MKGFMVNIGVNLRSISTHFSFSLKNLTYIWDRCLFRMTLYI